MKKSILTSILLFFLINDFTVLAHGKITTRNDCKWWAPKYKTEAYVWMPITQQKRSDRDCSFASCFASIHENRAYQYATVSSNLYYLHGAITGWQYIYGRGYPNKLISSAFENEYYKSKYPFLDASQVIPLIWHLTPLSKLI